MPRHAFQKPAALVWAQLALALLALWSAVFLAHRQGREEALAAAETEIAALARAHAEHSFASFQRIDMALEGLRQAWVEMPALFISEVHRYRALIRDLAFQVAVIDADGRLVYSNLAHAEDGVDCATLDHYAEPRARSARGIDRLYVGRLQPDPVSGRPAIQFARPIFSRGEFAGVVAISVDPAFFARYYATMAAVRQGRMHLLHESGSVLAGAPETAAALAPVGEGMTGHARVEGPHGGLVVGHYRIAEAGVALVVGVEMARVLAPVEAQQGRIALVALVASAVLLALGAVITRGMAARGRASAALAASEARLRALFSAFPEIVLVTDHADRLSMAHVPAGVHLPGTDPSTWTGRPLDRCLPPEMAGHLAAALAEVPAGDVPRAIEFSARVGDSERHYQATLSRFEAGGCVIVARDVTAARQAAEAQRIAATTFESQEGMMITDSRGIILRVNRAFSELTGYAAEEVLGQSPALLKSGRQDPEFYAGLWRALAEDGYWQGEIWNRRKGGEVYPEWLTITAVRDERGVTTHYVGAFSDISERKEAELQIRSLAFYDPLTGLANRRLLRDRAQQAMTASERSHLHGALLYVDLDHFKMLNDTRGHDAGDALLIGVAERLRAVVRDEDTVARMGGDEFVVLLEGLAADAAVGANQAAAVAEKMRQVLCAPFPLAGGDYAMSPSIGVALFLGNAVSFETLAKQADMALYEAKEAGRNGVRFFSHAIQEAVTARAALDADLRRAIGHDEFEVFLQPQRDPAGRRVGAEVLLRWRHPQRGLVFPGDFIAQAEESGLIVPIGDWVLARACAILADWAHDPCHAGERLSVNVSARQFHHPAFVDVVRRILRDSGADPGRLRLELTESVVLGDVAQVRARMEALRELGVTFSLDDFGTGYSSLAYLKHFPVSEVKIDRSFVQDLDGDAQSSAIVRAILAMSQSFGIVVVAEGVETEAQHALLAAFGCPLFQGYLHGHPVPLADYTRAANDARA